MAARENCSLAFPAPRQSRGTGWGPLYPALSLLIQTSFFLRAQPEPPSSPAPCGTEAGQLVRKQSTCFTPTSPSRLSSSREVPPDLPGTPEHLPAQG